MTNRTIPLSRGLVGIVDADDFDRVSQFKWHAIKRPRDGRFHVMRSSKSDGVRKTIYLHRWLMDAPIGMEVDHKNGDGLDNRRENLRICTRAQNARNFRRDSPRKSSRFHGVSWDRRYKRWLVVICAGDGMSRAKQKYIGRYRDETEAALAYDAAARTYHGEFAVTNFQERR
jgi:HNH endonuclease